MKIYLDTETNGLAGEVKLIQYAIDNEEVQFIRLFQGWESKPLIRNQLYKLWNLIDNTQTIFVGYNTQFDLFKLYQTFHKLLGYDYSSYERPVKPFKCRVLDLQVVAMQKSILSPFAFKRPGKSIAKLSRVPEAAKELIKEKVLEQLEKVIPDSIPIKVSEHECEGKGLISLSFGLDGRVSLKGLMRAYGLPTLKLDDVWVFPKEENTYLPYPQECHAKIRDKLDSIMKDLTSPFYKYAKLDILYLRVLEEKLNFPEIDYNSELTHNGAFVKYYGFDIDFDKLDEALSFYTEKVERIEKVLQSINPRSAPQRLELLKKHFPLLASTSKATLQALLKLKDADKEGLEKVRALLEYGPARQRLLQIKAVKECKTGKAHPELKIMGTATNRMSGTSGVNWQGIGAFEEDEEGKRVGLRTAILTPMVGDWSSFEVRIAAAVYQDDNLSKVVAEGLDMHSYTASIAHPLIIERLNELSIPENKRYEWVRKHYKEDDNFVVKCRKQIKAVVFGIFYGAQAFTISESLGITESEAQRILDLFFRAYPGIKRYRDIIEEKFLTADTVNWSANSINKMEVSLKDLTGFERRWDFEKKLSQIFWKLGHSQFRTGLSGQIVRDKNKGWQSIDNACRSAFLGASINIQSSASRQAVNFRVQATGSSIHKRLQAKLWSETRIGTLSIHDEVICITKGFDYDKVTEKIKKYEKDAGLIVPDLKFDYGKTERWSDK